MRSWRTLLLAALVLGAATGASFDRELERGEELLQEGRYADAVEPLEAAVRVADREPPERQVRALLALAEAYMTDPMLGREADAPPVLRRARAVIEAQLPGDTRRLVNVLERLGSCYVITGQWKQAREPFEAYLAAVEAQWGAERAYRSDVARNLIDVYSRLGLSDEALELRERREHPERVADAPLDPKLSYLSPNARDADGAGAYVHFTAEDMPLVVALHGLGNPERAREGEHVIDIEVRERRPYVRLEMGTGSVWALVDTGAMGSIMTTEEKARELGIEIAPDAGRRRYVNVLGTSLDSVQTLSRARLGGLDLGDVTLGIALGDESSIRVGRWLQDQTLVGLELLSDYHVRLDYAHQKLGLTPVAP